MRRVLIGAMFAVALTASPAIAQDPNYPPSDPPAVCTDPPCTTASTGFTDSEANAAGIGIVLLGAGTVALIAIRKVRR
jgi:hypothetical protein